MEGHSYISCIRINGVPILPPMISGNTREEMFQYKESAINIEKKLASLRIARQHDNDIHIGKVKKESKCKKNGRSFKENLVRFEYKSGICNECNVKSTNGIETEAFERCNETMEEALQHGKHLGMECKYEDQINLASNNVSISESIPVGVDMDCRLSETVSTKSSTLETVSEIWKPQVPKTLNVIPLTLSNSDCREAKKYQEVDLDNVEDIPKLVRQGSYVLETPSPILLAHMQMELADSTSAPCLEYVPTSSTNANRRKEWNVAQTEVEWECENRNKEMVPVSVPPLRTLTMFEENLYSNTGRKIRKSMSLQTKPESPFAMYPSTRSADCIQTMLAKERLGRSDLQASHDKRRDTDNSSAKKSKPQVWNKRNTVNSICKLGGSLEDLNERINGSVMNSLTEIFSRDAELKDSMCKSKSSVASDKLLTVYKKVQEMHKKQMAELMYRQQREQTLLQKEFEKQQLLLLTEIRKSFPEISVSLLSENIMSPATNQVTPHGDRYLENNDSSSENVRQSRHNLEEEDETKNRSDKTKIVPCPLDYIYSEMNYDNNPCPTSFSCKIQSSKIEASSNVNNTASKDEERDIVMQANGINTYGFKFLEESDECKRSNVSRELFPLDSKTIHVPILEKTIYGATHIKAVNVINAYARGYLVRRMMQTERVIALKNTYKEALHCMLKLHVDAPLNRSEFNFLHRLQLQCDAASMNIAELFAQSPQKRMQIIAQDRELKQSRIERPTSARSYSFATQRTLARKKLKEMEEYQPTSFVRSCTSRSRCQTWTSDIKERLISSKVLYHSIKRSTSAGTVRKPWR